MSVAPMPGSGGVTTRFVGIRQDIGEQVHLEERLRQSQKMEAVGTLVGGIALDFNTILAGMLGNLYLARMGLPEQHESTRRLQTVEKLGERAAETIRQLLAFSRRQGAGMQTIDLLSFLKEALALSTLSVPATLESKLDLTHEPLPLQADVTQLHQPGKSSSSPDTTAIFRWRRSWGSERMRSCSSPSIRSAFSWQSTRCSPPFRPEARQRADRQ